MWMYVLEGARLIVVESWGVLKTCLVIVSRVVSYSWGEANAPPPLLGLNYVL